MPCARGLAVAAVVMAGAACGVADSAGQANKTPTVPFDPLHDGGTSMSSKDAGGDVVDARVEAAPEAGPPQPVRTVFFVLMSYQPWSAVAGSASAPYINSVLPSAAHCEAYFAAPVQIGQSEPNDVWLEAGQDEGFVSNSPPTTNHSASTSHLVNQLEAAGISWKAYVDDIPGGACPVADASPYRTFNVPFLFFDDVVGNPPATTAKRCIQHVVPLSQLTVDLAKGAAPRYAFIAPDACDNMHDDCNTGDPVRQGDDWLSQTVPAILASSAYKDGGAIFIAWNFSNTGYVPIGFLALSANARPGFAGKTTVTPSSTLRSLQEIFGVTPLLGDAAKATDLAGLFTSFP